MKKLTLLAGCVLMNSLAFAEPILEQPMIHSHNDYQQVVPFWYAYSSNAQSIEVDLVIQDGALYISHGDDVIDKR
ncbi:MAG: alkaline phosphatase, partial [Wohlfahrtiimonas sp.]